MIITWTNGDATPATVISINFYQGDSLLTALAANVSNTGSYITTLRGRRIGSGSGYRVKIINTADTSRWDFSPTFSVYSTHTGVVTVTAPTLGAATVATSNLNITWTLTGGTIATSGSGVGIQLYKGVALVSNLVSLTAGNSYTWLVSTPLGSGSDYRIKVYSYADPALSDFSDNFTITSGFSGSFNITSPIAAASWQSGNVATITWTYSGTPGNFVNLQLYRGTLLVTSITTSTSTATGSYSWSVPGVETSALYRVKITSTSDVTLNAYSPDFTITGITPDVHEPDNQRVIAKVIPDLATQSRTLSYLDSDWVQINSIPGKRYLASIQAGFYVTASVADSNGSLIGVSQSGGSLQLLINPTYVGRYYVLVRYYSTTATYQGPYTISLRGYDASQSSYPVVFSQPTNTSVWAANNIYPIVWTPDSVAYGSTVSLALYRDTTFIMTITTGITNSGTYSWTVPGVATDTSYRIRISNYSSPLVYGYSPNFSISGMPPDNYEVDNIRIQAYAILVNGNAAQNHNLTFADTDWVQFNAIGGRRYVAAVQSSGTTNANFMDTTGTVQQVAQSGTAYQAIFTPTLSGRYYVRVFSPSPIATGTYSLALYSDSALSGLPTQFTAPDINTVMVTGLDTITWTPNPALYGTTVTLSLYQGTTLVQTISSVSNSGSLTWNVSAGLTTGPYRIRISNNSNTAIFGYSPVFSISGITPDNFEVDNTMATASVITTDSTLQNRTLTTADPDWIRFRALPGRNYWIKVTNAFPVTLGLYDSISLTPLQQVANTANPFVLLNNAYGGTYNIQVSGTSYGSYGLTVDEYQPDSLVVFTNPTAGITLTANSTNSVTWVPNSQLFTGTVSFYLYNGTVRVLSIGSATFSTGTSSWFLPAGMATGSNYQIRMYFNTVAYAASPRFGVSGLAPDLLEMNDSASMAYSLAPNAGRQSLNLTYLDRDWFLFNGVAGSTYVFRTVAATTLNNSIQLYSGQGAALLTTSTQLASDTGNTLTWTCPTTGVFTFQITAPTTGNYSLDFLQPQPSDLALVISAPAAGDTAVRRQSLPIRWSSLVSVGGSADIFLYNSGGLVQTIAANVSNNGSYNWYVPADTIALQGGVYYVRVISRIQSSINGNSGSFVLSNQPCTGSACPTTTWDLESNNGTFVATSSPITGGWGWGVPNYASGPTSAHSGTNVWGTNLTGPYSNSAIYQLVTPSFVVPTGGNLSFWQWYYTEACCEYEYVEISTNGGASYTALYTNYGGTSSISGGGSTPIWIQTNLSLSAYAGQNAILRFRFTSDGSVTAPGWYIDDIDVR